MINVKKKAVAVLAGLALACAVMFSTDLAEIGAFSNDGSTNIDSASMQIADEPKIGGTGGG